MRTLTVENLSASYGRNKILSGSFLQIERGRINSLVGRNGCGKTTLIKAVLGLLRDSTETLYIDGKTVPKKSRINYIAYLPQQPFLPKNTKVEAIVTMFLNDEERIEILNDDRIRPLLKMKASKLSGGENKYLEFFLVSSLNREVYIFDEPFIGIEPLYLEVVIERLKRLKGDNKYILITDHNFKTVKDVSDRFWHSRSGRLVPLENDEFSSLRESYLPDREKPSP